MKNILVLAESLRINETSSGIVSSSFIFKLKQLGYNVSVIYPKSFNYDVTWLDGCRLIPFTITKPQKSLIDRIPKLRALPTYLNFGFSNSFKFLIYDWKREVSKELINTKYDYCIVLGSGSTFSPHFAINELNINIPFFASMQDPFPLHFYPAPYHKKKTLLSFFLEFRFKKLLNKTDGIFFPSLKLAESMLMNYNLINKNHFIIPHISIKLNNLPLLDSDAEIKLDQSKINLIHAGLLLGPRNPHYLLNAINDLELNYPDLIQNVNFIFVGPFAREHKHIVSKSKSILFFNIRVSYAKSLELIEKSDAVFVIEAISNYSPFLPGKIADIFLNSKAIIALCPKDSEVMRILGDTPYHSELNDKEKIGKVILKFLDDYHSKNIHNNSNKLLEYTSICVDKTIKTIFN